jgi:sterol desaturase/sphingolipid hydroxylase (fatty acid hydroxylase superfamily)
VFEALVLPLVFASGFGGYAEMAFDATGLFLIGTMEIGLLVAVLGALEKWRPVEQQAGGSDHRVDIIYTVLNRIGLIPLLMFFLLTPVVGALDSALRVNDLIPPKLEDLLPWLNDAPFASLVIYLVILDFVGYWLHRGQHRLNWWWALHSLHHSQRQMTFWSDDRNHLLDTLIIDAAFALVALLIGVMPGQFITIVAATRVAQSLQHANVRLWFGRVGEHLLVSPRFHRVHHAIGLGHEGEARGCNFAVLFPVWDVLFGTANFTAAYPATGIRDQLDGTTYGERFWAQQWLGLKRIAASFGRSS